MIRIDLNRFSLSLALLGELIMLAVHSRTRERLLAIFRIAQGDSAATVCHELQRDHHTVLKWAHDVSSGGPSALVYKHSGGTPSQLCSLAPLLVDVIEESWSLAALPRVRKYANAPAQLDIAKEHSATQQTDLVTTPQATPEQAPFLPPAFRWTLRTLCALVLRITGRLVS